MFIFRYFFKQTHESDMKQHFKHLNVYKTQQNCNLTTTRIFLIFIKYSKATGTENTHERLKRTFQ